MLKDFDTTTERWRLAHPDFSQVPLFGIGKLYGLAGLDEKRWLSLVQDACHELGVPPN